MTYEVTPLSQPLISYEPLFDVARTPSTDALSGRAEGRYEVVRLSQAASRERSPSICSDEIFTSKAFLGAVVLPSLT